jgi:ribose transport system ATP-binding protein
LSIIDAELVNFETPADSKAHGVALIYQEFNLVPELTAAENIYLRIEAQRFGFINRKKLNQDAAAILQRIGVEVDLHTPIKYLSVAQQ